MAEEAKSAGFGPVMARTAGMLTKLLTSRFFVAHRENKTARYQAVSERERRDSNPRPPA
jgi:hypothetical protein